MIVWVDCNEELGTLSIKSNSSSCSVDNRHDRDRVCGNPVSKDFEIMKYSDRVIAKKKQGAGSLFRDASQRN